MLNASFTRFWAFQIQHRPLNTPPFEPEFLYEHFLRCCEATNNHKVDDPDETDGETPTAKAVNPAVLKKKSKRAKSGYGKIQKPKKSKQPKTPRQPKPPKPGSWNVQLEVHMSHCRSGRLVVSNPEKLAINEDKVGGIYPLTPTTISLNAQSVATSSVIADSYEFMDFDLMGA
jgi:hypothetical protein